MRHDRRLLLPAGLLLGGLLLAAMVQADVPRRGKVVRDSGAKAEWSTVGRGRPRQRRA